MTKALYIPEIRDEVAQYLKVADLCACVLISKNWYDAFTPSLWRIVQLGRQDTSRPTLKNVSKHAFFVQDLSLVRSDLTPIVLFDHTFPRLTSFKMDIRNGKVESRNKSRINNNDLNDGVETSQVQESATNPPKEAPLEDNQVWDLGHLIEVNGPSMIDITGKEFGPFFERHAATLRRLDVSLVDPIPSFSMDWMFHCPHLQSLKLSDLSINTADQWYNCLRAWESCRLVTLRLYLPALPTLFPKNVKRYGTPCVGSSSEEIGVNGNEEGEQYPVIRRLSLRNWICTCARRQSRSNFS